MKVLVCDDREDLGLEIVKAIRNAEQADIEITDLFAKAFDDELEKVLDKADAFSQTSGKDLLTDTTVFGDFDIVIIDNNLTHLRKAGKRLTAESVAGYVRAFTAVPFIVSLNKNPDVDFDLRYLVGDYATHADLALNTNHLENPALWTGKHADAKDGFRPWYWPTLATVAGRRRVQIDFVKKHLGESVVRALDIPTDDDTIGFLSLHARGALSPDAESIDEVTFLDVFVAQNRSLPAKSEREELKRNAEGGDSDLWQIISRIVAADIDLWFRRDVLGPQEPLVDAPHLLMRMPFLLGDRTSDIKQWNAAISENDVPFGMERNLYDEHLAQAKFAHDMWVPSPTFWWPKLKANENLNELFFAPEQEWAEVVFCEDSSDFRERSPENEKTPPIEFSAEFEGSWGHRYVARLDKFGYAPRSRLMF